MESWNGSSKDDEEEEFTNNDEDDARSICTGGFGALAVYEGTCGPRREQTPLRFGYGAFSLCSVLLGCMANVYITLSAFDQHGLSVRRTGLGCCDRCCALKPVSIVLLG